MKTQNELKERINKIGEEIRNLHRAHYEDKEYMKLIRKAEKLKEKIEKKNEPKIQELYEERNKLRDELENKKLSKKIQLSSYLLGWLRQYMVGIDWGYKNPFVAWHSEDERFVILTHPGHTTGQGTAMGSGGYYYSPTDHYLIDTKISTDGLQGHKMGYKIGNYIEGRLTKAKKQELLDRLEEYKKEKNIKCTSPKNKKEKK